MIRPKPRAGHAGHEGLGEQQGGLHVDRLHPAPDGQIQAGQVGPVERGRRVDQHVTAAGLVQHPLRCRPDLLLVGEVHGNVARSVQDEDPMARCGQGRRDATADGPGARQAGAVTPWPGMSPRSPRSGRTPWRR